MVEVPASWCLHICRLGNDIKKAGLPWKKKVAFTTYTC